MVIGYRALPADSMGISGAFHAMSWLQEGSANVVFLGKDGADLCDSLSTFAGDALSSQVN